MSPFDVWKAALAATESDGNPEAWGDNGRACGRWQMHPAFFDEWRVRARLGMTWDDWFNEALYHFWRVAEQHGVSDLEAAMGFHLHGTTYGLASEDPTYAERFTSALNGVLAE